MKEFTDRTAAVFVGSWLSDNENMVIRTTERYTTVDGWSYGTQDSDTAKMLVSMLTAAYSDTTTVIAFGDDFSITVYIESDTGVQRFTSLAYSQQ